MCLRGIGLELSVDSVLHEAFDSIDCYCVAVALNYGIQARMRSSLTEPRENKAGQDKPDLVEAS